MEDEKIDKGESQKTPAEDEKTQIEADGNGGGDDEKKPDPADPHGTKKEDETQEQFYQRQLKEKDELIKRRKGEAEHYRKEAQSLKEKMKEKEPERTEEKVEEQPVKGKDDEFKKIRVEMALNGIKDANKRKLIELELESLNFGSDVDSIMSAVDRAEAIVDAPYLRKAAQRRGAEHAQDVEAASFADQGTHGKGDRSERALHPEAAATIAEARRQMPKTIK